MTVSVILTTGLPASGKTTYAKQLVAESGGQLKRVNLDDIRFMTANGEYNKENEELALKIQDKTVLAAVQQGFNVIVDNTHLHSRIPNRIRTILACEDVEYRVADFLSVPVEECIRRDEERGARGERSVGKDVIEKMARGRRKWTLTPGYMSEWKRPEPYEPDLGEPKAVIVDMDGTLALHNGRSPYDTARCGEDLLNRPLDKVLYAIYGWDDVQIIILSGRDAKYRKETADWLNKHGVPYRRLLMRPEGDRRRDDIVKAELFDEYIRDNYHVIMAFDDRDRVVNLWRSMGIMTAQMDFGDF